MLGERLVCGWLSLSLLVEMHVFLVSYYLIIFLLARRSTNKTEKKLIGSLDIVFLKQCALRFLNGNCKGIVFLENSASMLDVTIDVNHLPW